MAYTSRGGMHKRERKRGAGGTTLHATLRCAEGQGFSTPEWNRYVMKHKEGGIGPCAYVQKLPKALLGGSNPTSGTEGHTL